MKKYKKDKLHDKQGHKRKNGIADCSHKKESNCINISKTLSKPMHFQLCFERGRDFQYLSAEAQARHLKLGTINKLSPKACTPKANLIIYRSRLHAKSMQRLK